MSYRVSILDRIKDLLGEDFVLEPGMTVNYSWQDGYETLKTVLPNGGGTEFRGAYHPAVNCEGNPCRHCGMARVSDA